MISSRLSFLVAAALLFPAAAAHAGPLTFGQFAYSDQAVADVDFTGNSSSGGFVPLPPVTGVYDAAFAFAPSGSSAQPLQSLDEYTSDQWIAFSGIAPLQTLSGTGGTTSATLTLQFKFTVNTAQNLVYTVGIAPLSGFPYSANFATDGSFTLEKTSAGDPFTTIYEEYHSSSDPGQLGLSHIDAVAYFPVGDYLMSIDVTSSILADVTPPGGTNDYGGGFTFIIPEPATLALFAIGGLLITRGRSRHARA